MLKCLPYDYVELVTKHLEKLDDNNPDQDPNHCSIMYDGGYFEIEYYPKEDFVRIIDNDSHSVYTLTHYDTPLDISDMVDLRSLLDHIEANLDITLIEWMDCLLADRKIYVGKLINIYQNEDHYLIEAINGNTYYITPDELKAFRDCPINPSIVSGMLGIEFSAESVIEGMDDISKIDDSIYNYLQTLMNAENLSNHVSISYAEQLPNIDLRGFDGHDCVYMYGVRVKLSITEYRLSVLINDVWHVGCNLLPVVSVDGTTTNIYHVHPSKRSDDSVHIDYPLLKHFIETINIAAKVL